MIREVRFFFETQALFLNLLLFYLESELASYFALVSSVLVKKILSTLKLVVGISHGVTVVCCL